MKHKYIILPIIAIAFAAPVFATQTEPEMEPAPEIEVPADASLLEDQDGIETEVAGIGINVNGSQLHITNAAGQTLEIYNLAGVRVTTVRIDSDDKTLNLNLQKGCYMVKVGKVVRKINIR